MKEVIKVLHVLQRMEPAGVQALLMNIYRHIDREKVQFDFLVHYTAPQFFDKEIEKLGGNLYRLSVREDYNFIKYQKQLHRFFHEHPEYRIVHGHMDSLGAFYLGVAEKYGVPIRIAHSHTNGMQNDAKKYLKLFTNQRYAKHATDLFACSDDAGRYMFRDQQFKVINNAIDSERFRFDDEKRTNKRKELGIQSKFVVGCVGRFAPCKNHKFSIDVFERVLESNENAVLLLIGSGIMQDEIKMYVQEKGLENVVLFLGNQRDMAELYMAMDVFLFPSLYEGLGIVGIEAQAAGTPTVCTDTLPKELSVTPLLTRLPLGDSKQWAQAVQSAAGSVESHSDMRKYIKEANYDIEGLVQYLMQFYISKQNQCFNETGYEKSSIS